MAEIPGVHLSVYEVATSLPLLAVGFAAGAQRPFAVGLKQGELGLRWIGDKAGAGLSTVRQYECIHTSLGSLARYVSGLDFLWRWKGQKEQTTERFRGAELRLGPLPQKRTMSLPMPHDPTVSGR